MKLKEEKTMKKLSKIFAVVLCLVMVMAMLPMGVSAATEKYVEFTVDSLGLTSNSYTAGTTTVDGVAVEWIQLGNYGDGIQVRDKNGNTSMFWNTSALGSGITKIELTYSDSKDVTYANPDAVIFNFGNAAQGSTYSTKLSTVAGVKSYTITPDANTYTYFYMEHDLGYTFYWKSIKVYYNEGGNGGNQGGNTGTQDPVTPPPATDDVSIADGEYVIIAPAFNKALSSEKALNQDGSVGFYNAGVDVTVSGSTVTGYGDTEKWIVTNNDDGSITISQNGKNLALADSYSSMNLGEVNDKWVLEDAGNGLFYVKNVVRGNYIEWYNDMNNWSSYNKIGSGKEDLFALQFVALNVQEPGENPGETPSEPSEPNQPTGDMSIAGLVIALTAATGAAIVLTKKKEF